MFNDLHHGLVIRCKHWIDNNDVAHQMAHVKAVAKEARGIAEKYGLDPIRMELAALLHDIYSGRDRKDHHNLAAAWTRQNLGQYGYDVETVECVAQMCAEHRASLRGDYSNIYCEAFSAADRGPLSLVGSAERVIGNHLKRISKDEIVAKFPEFYTKLMSKFGREGYARPNSIHAEYYKENIEEFIDETKTEEYALYVVLCHRESCWDFDVLRTIEETDKYLLPDDRIYTYQWQTDTFVDDARMIEHPSFDVPVTKGRVLYTKGVI